MYYGIVCVAVVMFGLQFFCNQQYQRESGSGAASSMFFIVGSSLLGALVLWLGNGLQLAIAPFTLWMAAFTALNSIACTVCSLKALGRIDLSLYSLFSMLGGMVLPFAAGIFFYGEPMTPGKLLCLLTVAVALMLGVRRETAGGGIYYAGIFIFNGMSGVLSKIFQAASCVKTDAASYSIWSAVLSAVFAGLIWLLLKERRVRLTGRSVLWMGGCGALNKVANLLLLLALARLPASVQYPMVTGGVMIVSTLLGYFTPEKPTRRELVAVALSFLGITALVLL